jgi:hypothetical protein
VVAVESRAALRRIASACDRNCRGAGYRDLQDFCSNYLRKIKHTDRVVNIDSIYRNSM